MVKLRPNEGETVGVSTEWTDSERQILSALIRQDIDALLDEEAKLRKTIKWEAPCLDNIRQQREALMQLNQFTESMPAAFLEMNREHYNEYLSTES